MIPRNLDESPIDVAERKGLMARRFHHHGSEAWRETVTQHMPDTWPAARLALQARIAALDVADDEGVIDLTQEAAA
jgi:hypothetical protein